MSEKISVQITATDGASRVFQQVASGAERLDQSFDKVEQGSKDLARESRSLEQSMRDVDLSYRDIGASLGILATGVALAGRSFRDQEVALRTLERGYGDAADELEAFADQIQETTNFSNDSAVASANIFRTLADNYGFTAGQIQQLIAISADLAATMGIGLEDAAMRVQSAMRGEAEAAEYLGLTLNDRALGLDRVSTSMSEAERAQIRFNALQEQSAFALGTAAEQADTTYGAMTQLRDSVQDAAQAFGDFIGPVGEIGAFAADNAVQIAAMWLALGQLGKTAKGLNDVAKAMTGISVASKAATVTPAILGLAAAAGLLYLGYEALVDKGDFLPESFDNIAAGAADATEAIAMLSKAGEQAAVSIGTDVRTALNQASREVLEMFRLSGEQATFQPGRASAEQQAAHDANMARLNELIAKYGEWDGAAEDVAEAEGDLLAILTGTGALHDQQMTALEQTNAAYKAGALTFPQYLAGLDMVADMTGNVTTAMDAATESVNPFTQAITEQEKALVLANQTLEQYLQNQQIGGQTLAGEHREAAAAIEAETEARENGIVAMQAYLEIEQRIAGNSFAAGIDVDANANLTALWLQSAEQRAAAVRREAIELANLQTQFTETFEAMQASATQASDTIDTVFGAIVGNTNAIASQSQDVADWAAGLTVATEHLDEWGNSLGWWSLADELVYDATISQEQYNAAVQANSDIQAANYSIQRDVLSIQAQLAPVIATATEALAVQMDEIANGSTDAQLFALGMMDAATSSQALALAQGYISDQDTFGPLIQQAAELNPMLAQILEEMGLISYNPATGVVTLEGDEEALSDIQLLSEAIGDLDGTLATLIAILEDDASGPISDVDGAIGDLDGNTATVYANLVDNATSGIYAASAALRALDGQSATAYITTIQQTIGSPFAQGLGGVAGYGRGGVVAELAEWGPELVSFASGGMALAPTRGLYNLSPGDYVHTAPATAAKLNGNGVSVIVNINGPASWDDAAEQVSRKIVPAIQRAMREHERSLGAYS